MSVGNVAGCTSCCIITPSTWSNSAAVLSASPGISGSCLPAIASGSNSSSQPAPERACSLRIDTDSILAIWEIAAIGTAIGISVQFVAQ